MTNVLNEVMQMFIHDTGFQYIPGPMLIMWPICGLLFYLAIKKQYEPLLLVPIAFGVLLANFPGGDMGVVQANENGMVMVNGVM